MWGLLLGKGEDDLQEVGGADLKITDWTIPLSNNSNLLTAKVVKTLESEETLAEMKYDEICKKRRSIVLRKSWKFYTLVVSLCRDTKRLDYAALHVLECDLLWPYFLTLKAITKPTIDGNRVVASPDAPDGWSKTREKILSQVLSLSGGETAEDDYAVLRKGEYSVEHDGLLRSAIKRLLVDARLATTELLEIAEKVVSILRLSNCVWMGPVKTEERAHQKAVIKYGGDPFKITDFVRLMLVVPDLAAAIACVEIISSKYEARLVRLELDKLKKRKIPGGYRHITVNLLVNGHIAEIQIHIECMFQVLRGMEGVHRHQNNAREFRTDSITGAFDLLIDLNKAAISDLLNVADDAIIEREKRRSQKDNTPAGYLSKLSSNAKIKSVDESIITAKFAKAGLLVMNSQYLDAEIIFNELHALRVRDKRYGGASPEAIQLLKLAEYCQKKQGKADEAKETNDAAKRSSWAAEEEVMNQQWWISLINFDLGRDLAANEVGDSDIDGVICVLTTTHLLLTL